MSAQPHEQTEEELATALTLLMAVADCTDSDLFTDWHQSLQSTVSSLFNTIHLLQKQAATEKAGASASASPRPRYIGEANHD